MSLRFPLSKRSNNFAQRLIRQKVPEQTDLIKPKKGLMLRRC